jgi:Rho termination factor, N-terminal domain
MTAYGIFGDVEASPKLVRAALSDLLEAHQRVTPEGDFWLMVGVRNGETKVHDEILDWAARNEVYFEVVTPSARYMPYTEPAKLTVSPSFMLDVVEVMHREEGGKILALVGDQTPRTDVLRALAKAKDNGTEIRDLAEAGLTLILFKGDDPPLDTPEESNMATEEVEASLAELGEYADDTDDAETAEEAQGLLMEAAAEAGLDPDEYPTWAELATALQELLDAGEEEESVEVDGEVLTRESLVGKEISEIKQLAKAAGIEGYSKMRREPLINALLGVEPEPAAAAAPPARKATGAAKKAASAADGDGDVGLGGAALTEADVERIAGAVVSKLAAALSTG